MFALRKSPSTFSRSLSGLRGNSTLSVYSSPSSQPNPVPKSKASESTVTVSPKTQGRRVRKRIAPKRPDISLESPRQWNRPLRAGVLPAYDLALGILRKDSQNLKRELEVLLKQVDEKEVRYKELDSELQAFTDADAAQSSRLKEERNSLGTEIEEMLNKVNILEVQSEINLPDVRWTVNNAMADMSKVSHRHLLEQKWRRDGALDLLMERIYQMRVVPDVLPEISPSFDLHVVARSLSAETAVTKKAHSEVEPGVFLKPKQTLSPPKLFATVFHTDVRLYTMLLIDLDVPDPETASFTTFLHWMKPNIALSAISPSLIPDLNTHTRYIPPHPQRGTPYHRYVCLVLPQPPIGVPDYMLRGVAGAKGPTSAHLDIPIVSDAERRGFDVREFSSLWNLNGAKGGGAHMWREIWDDTVSQVYRDVLKMDEPLYGRPPKADAYAHFKRERRYVA